MHKKKFHLGIIGGCFPVQDGIESQALYHQIIVRMLYENYNLEMEILVEQYDSIKEGETKTVRLVNDTELDAILFHIRPDPYLKMSKFLFRYITPSDRLTYSFNFPIMKHNISERFSMYEYKGSYKPKKKGHCFLNPFFRELNYFVGMLLGINSYATRMEQRLVDRIVNICKREKKRVLLVGPPSRPRSKLENYFCRLLEKKMFKLYGCSETQYVSIYGSFSETGEYLFFEDGIHINPIGHKRIATLLFPAIAKVAITNESNKSP